MYFKFLNLAGLALILATSPAVASDINLGRSIYQRHCVSCHGADGSGSMAGAPDFRRGRGLMQSDQALVSRIENGKRACPAYRGILKEQEILDVIAYIRTLF
ncbi:MAG: c-type cytochrome [Gammaproteobacteria bacterium]|nr:MAG: c-type cytochrome [Gammaproteobacteria bacterium]